MTPTLRIATRADARTLAELHVRGWRWGYRGLLPPALLDSLSVEEWERKWAARLAVSRHDAWTWIAQASDGPVGFASLGSPRDADEAPGTAELMALYLAESAAGQGIGRRLLDHAVADLRARGFRRAYLWVLETNARACRFYAKAGWRPDGGPGIGARTELRDGAELRDLRYVLSL